MSNHGWTCGQCGRSVEAGRTACPGCGAPRPATRPASPPERTAAASTARPVRAGAPGGALVDRMEQLVQWADAARPLGVQLPALPSWSQDAAARSEHPELWVEAVTRAEQESRKRCSELVDRIYDRLAPRLVRLEAYSVGTRLEREQLEEAARSVRTGDVASALWTIPQLERVIVVKERHLDQARDDLERLLTLLRDLDAIGVRSAGDPASLARELESDLRSGQLATLRQRLRTLRSRAADGLTAALPGYVGRLGDRLLIERGRGLSNDADTRDLAEGARRVLDGRVEEGARLLRRLGAPRGILAGPSGPPAP